MCDHSRDQSSREKAKHDPCSYEEYGASPGATVTACFSPFISNPGRLEDLTYSPFEFDQIRMDVRRRLLVLDREFVMIIRIILLSYLVRDFQ